MRTRDVAHIVIEADTPFKVGSNASDFLQDSPIQRDFNALPMILGTSLTGVLRKEFEQLKGSQKVKDIFGDENGSKVIVSNALMLDEDEKVHEELLLEKSSFLKIFETLPIREHTAITEKGVAKEHAKFDEEVLYKGTRFKFSIEMIEDEKDSFEEVLGLLAGNTFRIGGGSTKGFGKLKIVEIRCERFESDSYEQYSSSLNSALGDLYEVKAEVTQQYTSYKLRITPDDFFMFGSGFGDEDADATAVYEHVIDYDKKGLSEKRVLMPASSLKGAIAHRTVFHFNRLEGKSIENSDGILLLSEVFGSAKESDGDGAGLKGKVIFSDCYQNDNQETKTFDHVAIDRFTGGAIDGALFQEKTLSQKDLWKIEILMDKDVQGNALQAFENTLDDITTGMLPLGGMTTKGHGVFGGTWSKEQSNA